MLTNTRFLHSLTPLLPSLTEFEQKEYIKEKIDWSYINFTDNQVSSSSYFFNKNILQPLCAVIKYIVLSKRLR